MTKLISGHGNRAIMIGSILENYGPMEEGGVYIKWRWAKARQKEGRMNLE